jgi:ketosteroid isomerase-like protein
MPRENVEIAKAYFRTFDSGDLDAAAEYLAPDVRWLNHGVFDEEMLEGRVAVRAYWDRILGALPFFHDEPAFSGAEDRVCVTARLRVRGATSGVELDAPCGYALTLRDGLVTRSEYFADPDEARAAAGLEAT